MEQKQLLKQNPFFPAAAAAFPGSIVPTLSIN